MYDPDVPTRQVALGRVQHTSRMTSTVFAVGLDKLPDAENDTVSAALVGFDLHSHMLAKATLTGFYGR
jgi:phosphatidylethanolamine-binding protein (PEBP) family uncharacterized protein